MTLWPGEAAAVPSYITVTDEWALRNNFLDQQAAFEAKGTPLFKVASWLPSDTTPNLDKLLDKRHKVLGTLAGGVATNMAEVMRQVDDGKVSVDDAIMEKAAAKANAESLARARARLKEQADKRKTVRKVVFK